MNADPTVFVVDDDPAIRKSLQWLIESVGLRVQTHASAPDFLKNYDADVPGCLVLDIRMPGMSGLELQEQLAEHDIEIPIIIVTGYGDVPMAVRAMKHGAVDFIEKPVSDQVLLDQIQRAIADDLSNRQQHAAELSILERFERLTRREREVIELVIAGMTSKEVGEELGVNFKTIEAHRAKIMKKMEARGVSHLIRMCFSVNWPGERTTTNTA